MLIFHKKYPFSMKNISFTNEKHKNNIKYNADENNCANRSTIFNYPSV